MDDNASIKILFLSADPKEQPRLRIGEEFGKIQDIIYSSRYRDRITLEERWSVGIDNFSQALCNHQPDIVHFSGHGLDTGELCFENAGGMQPVEPEVLADWFELVSNQTSSCK